MLHWSLRSRIPITQFDKRWTLHYVLQWIAGQSVVGRMPGCSTEATTTERLESDVKGAFRPSARESSAKMSLPVVSHLDRVHGSVKDRTGSLALSQ